jgi:hypothetical protein
MNESRVDNNKPVKNWFELPLQTDFAGFETQLEQFVNTYTESGFTKANIAPYRSAYGEMLGMGMKPSRAGVAQNYSVRLYFYDTTSFIPEDAEVIFFVSYLGLNRLLLTVPPGFVKAYKFAQSFVSRCRELWPQHPTYSPQQVYQQDATAPQQSGGINFGPINSAGDVNINLSHVAGHDQIGAYASPVPVSPTYQELLQDGIKFLKSLLYDKAIDKLKRATELEGTETIAHYYLALALLKGRSFNSSSLHPRTRNEIEKHLIDAHAGDPNWLPPIILLAVMEIEYHSLHGTPNKNVVIDDVAKMVKQQGLSLEERQLLSSYTLKDRTKRRLHLAF